jgi:hypothetical protein
MSNTNLATFYFSALLGYKAHQIASQLAAKIREIDPDSEKAKLFYLLALARVVGEMYFRTRGFKVKAVDFSQWDARNKSIYEICCLDVEGYGRVLLIPCGALVESVSLPSEAQENILAYMIVELDSEVEPLEELEEGTILGFVREFQPEVELDSLEDLEKLPELLTQPIAKPETAAVGQEIGIWLNEMFQKGWRNFESLSDSLSQKQWVRASGASAMNSGSAVTANNIRKPVNLQDVQQDIELLVSLATEANSMLNVSIQLVALQPVTQKKFWSKNVFLPEGLEIALKLDAENLGTPVITGKKQEEIFLLSRLSVDRGTQIEVKIKSARSEAIEIISLPL